MPMMMMGGGGGGPAAEPVPDAPVTALDSLRVMLAIKFKKDIKEIGEATTIKDMAAGKSAIQNEVVGELAEEFGSGPEGGAEIPLKELAGKFPGYNAMGKVTSAHVTKMLQSKMPGGFSASAAKEYLAEERMLGPGRTDSVLLYAAASAPAARLNAVAEAKAFLDAAADSYATHAGVTIPRASQGGGGGGGMPMMMMGGGGDPKEMKDHKDKLKRLLLDQIDASHEYLDIHALEHEGKLEDEQELRMGIESRLDALTAELGAAFMDGITDLQHTALKARTYDSWWSWGLGAASSLVRASPSVSLGRTYAGLPCIPSGSITSWTATPATRP